ncbi:hypothetical protein RIF29_09576 [Crotalaria pallida]|uniref:Uncharacterized protein n=1 Tax=Crotalaria pallida TaxID=3830 RepID=A0AAN9IHY9_CROPI
MEVMVAPGSSTGFTNNVIGSKEKEQLNFHGGGGASSGSNMQSRCHRRHLRVHHLPASPTVVAPSSLAARKAPTRHCLLLRV